MEQLLQHEGLASRSNDRGHTRCTISTNHGTDQRGKGKVVHGKFDTTQVAITAGSMWTQYENDQVVRCPRRETTAQ